MIGKANSIVEHVIQIKNGTCHCECKKYHKCKKDYSWNPRHVFVRIANI